MNHIYHWGHKLYDIYIYICVCRKRDGEILFSMLICWKEEGGKKEDSKESLSIIGKLLSSNLFCCPSHVNVMKTISGEKIHLQYTSVHKIQDP